MYTISAKIFKTGALAALLVLFFALCACAESLTLQLRADEENFLYYPEVNTYDSHGVVINGHPAPEIYKTDELYTNFIRRYFQYDLGFQQAGIAGGTINTSGDRHSGIYQEDGFPCAFDCIIDDNSPGTIEYDPRRCINILDTCIKTTGTVSPGISTDCFVAKDTFVETEANSSPAIYGRAFYIQGGQYITKGTGSPVISFERCVNIPETLKVFDSGSYDSGSEFHADSVRNLKTAWNYGSLENAQIVNSFLQAKNDSAIEFYGGSLQIKDSHIEGRGIYTHREGAISIAGGTILNNNGTTFNIFSSKVEITLNNALVYNSPANGLLYFANCEESKFTAVNQTIQGKVSTYRTNTNYFALYDNSVFNGAIYSDNSSLAVFIDPSSSWTLTGDSRIKSLECYGNIDLNGHTLYINGVAYTDLSPFRVTGVSLNKTSISLETGKSEQLKTIVTPDNAFNKNLIWVSYDESVATVSEDGTVKGVAPGTTTIRVKTKDGGFTAKCKVKVADPKIAVMSVALNKATLSLTTGKSETLLATITPSGATNKNVTWSSYDESIATVSAAGVVKAIAPGTTTIRVKTKDGGYTAKCKVKVSDPKIAVTGVALSKTSVSLEKGKSLTLTATVSPSNATDKTVTWMSYDTSIATVTSAGVVKGVKAGTTTIRVKTKDGGFTAKCKVKVTVPAVAVTGVSLNKTSLTLSKGSTETLKATVTPSNATDKTVTWMSYDTSIATVTSAGVVKGVKAGTTTIRAKTKDGGFTVKCKVKVQ